MSNSPSTSNKTPTSDKKASSKKSTPTSDSNKSYAQAVSSSAPSSSAKKRAAQLTATPTRADDFEIVSKDPVDSEPFEQVSHKDTEIAEDFGEVSGKEAPHPEELEGNGKAYGKNATAVKTSMKGSKFKPFAGDKLRGPKEWSEAAEGGGEDDEDQKDEQAYKSAKAKSKGEPS